MAKKYDTLHFTLTKHKVQTEEILEQLQDMRELEIRRKGIFKRSYGRVII